MRYFLKKTAIMLVTVLGISLLAYLAFGLIPGDPTAKLLGTDFTPERAEALREALGLNKNIFVRYTEWLGGFLTGNMGTSYSYMLPVEEVMAGKPAVTAALSLMAWALTILISIPMGILLARYAGSRLDRGFVAVNQVFMAVPSFFIGILFTWLFGLVLRLFVPGDFVGFEEGFFACLGYLFFPALAIALPKAAMVTKLLRASILQQMNEDYVRTAYSRGNSRWAVIRRHVLRNAVLPVITFLAMTLADIVAGSIIVEQVFAIPGIGRLLVLSIANRDYPVVQAIVVGLAALVIVMNYLSDLAYQYIDPRIRLT